MQAACISRELLGRNSSMVAASPVFIPLYEKRLAVGESGAGLFSVAANLMKINNLSRLPSR